MAGGPGREAAMKRAVLERLAAVLVLGGLYLRRVYSPAAGAGGCGGPVRGARANSQALVNLRKKERPPVLRTPNGPKKKVDPPLL